MTNLDLETFIEQRVNPIGKHIWPLLGKYEIYMNALTNYVQIDDHETNDSLTLYGNEASSLITKVVNFYFEVQYLELSDCALYLADTEGYLDQLATQWE